MFIKSTRKSKLNILVSAIGILPLVSVGVVISLILHSKITPIYQRVLTH